MSKSISVYPGQESIICQQDLLVSWRSFLPTPLERNLGANVKVVYTTEKGLDECLSCPCSFTLACDIPLRFTVGLFDFDDTMKEYLSDEIDEVIEEEGECAIFKNVSELRVRELINKANYYINITSPANRGEDESQYVLAFAKAFTQLTQGIMFLTEPKFFKSPYGIYQNNSSKTV